MWCKHGIGHLPERGKSIEWFFTNDLSKEIYCGSPETLRVSWRKAHPLGVFLLTFHATFKTSKRESVSDRLVLPGFLTISVAMRDDGRSGLVYLHRERIGSGSVPLP